MILQRSNILDKFGVSQRCLSDTDSLIDFLLLDIYYVNSVFYVLSDENKYIGSITKEMLRDTSVEFLFSNPTLKDVCNVMCATNAYKLISDDIESHLSEIVKIFESNPAIIELPIVKDNNELIAIIDKFKLSSLILTPERSPDKPILDWAYTKRYIESNMGLNQYSRNIWSQHGEDGIIEELFSRIGMKEKFAVEFGGWDGVYLCNIRNLIVNHGYSGLFIEGDSAKAAECKKNYSSYDNVICAEGFVGFIEQKKLDVYLSENNVPKDFDLLSIDIDGYDYHVWESLKEFNPRVVIIEYNITIPNDVFFVNPCSEGILQGSSASALVALGYKKDYELVAVTLSNCIFVKAEEYEKVGISENRLETLRNENYLSDGVYFQTYDKQLLKKGYPRFFWG